MRTNKTTHATESTTDHRAAPAQSRSRRGFLRKATGIGILGMTGMALATEPVSASEADEDNRSSHTNSITVKGKGRGRTKYAFITTGDIDNMGRAEDNDDNREIRRYGDTIIGYIHPNGVDRFAFNGVLEEVQIRGHAYMDVDLPNVSD